MKYETAFKEYFSKVNIFTFRDAERFLTKRGASNQYIKLFMHRQRAGHGLIGLGRGYYTFHDNEAMVGFRFAPFYYGLEYALTIRRLWTQMANPVVITASKAIPGRRMVAGHSIIVRRISERAMFGFDYVKYSGMFVPVSDAEKTLIDFIYYRIRLGDEDMRSLLKATDPRVLRRYASRSGKRVRNELRRIGGVKL